MASSITKQAYSRQDMYGVGSPCASGSGCEPAGSWMRRSRTKVAPLSDSAITNSPHLLRASSGPPARPAPAPPDTQLAAHLARHLALYGQFQAEAALARRPAAALESFEDPLAILG